MGRMPRMMPVISVTRVIMVVKIIIRVGKVIRAINIIKVIRIKVIRASLQCMGRMSAQKYHVIRVPRRVTEVAQNCE